LRGCISTTRTPSPRFDSRSHVCWPDGCPAAHVVIAARTRWKSENENNNVLKNYGYHLEHNFGHGGQYLAMVLVMLNLLAFLFHTVLDLCDEPYRRARAELATRQTFFNDLQALTRYMYFENWQVLIHFMFTQLELDTDSPSPPRRRMKRR